MHKTTEDPSVPRSDAAATARGHLACVVGARPNFVKMAPLLRALGAYSGIRVTLVHTGQHYDDSLFDVFFADFGMPRPDVSLEVGSGRHGAQSAKVLERFEAFLDQAKEQGTPCHRVLVVGDVNSTMAAALAAVKLGIPVAHVEAGLRSFDRSMPEEINRVVTDAVSDLLFVSEPSGMDNLRREGQPEERLHLVGNVMIDTLHWLLPKARALDAPRRHGLSPGNYGVVTLHRPSNVDDPTTLRRLVDVLTETSRELPLAFPIHPRTKQRIAANGLADRLDAARGIMQFPPLGYLEFLALVADSRLIVTDSGGLQEETTALGIPCLTFRPNTERPITIEQGTNTLIGDDTAALRHHLRSILEGVYKRGRCPELWDGQAANRIAAVLAESLTAKYHDR